MKTHRKLSANAGLGLVLAWVASVPVLTAEPPVAGGEAAGQAQSVTSAAPAPSILADPPVAAAGAVGQAQSVNLPPEGSPPLLRNVELLFPTQGNVASVEPLSYLYYMEVGDLVSAPSQQKWVPYTEATERVAIEDVRRLWDTGFLEDIWLEVVDEPWDNGVVGKRLIYNLEERQRVRMVTFEGSAEIDRADVDEAMRENGIALKVDSFIDLSAIGRVKNLVQFMFAEKGYQFAEVTHQITELAGGPKTVEVRFHLDEGPKVFVDDISFVGNEVMSDRQLRGKMKETKERWWLSWISGRGTYKEAEFEQDADRIISFYRDEGYIDSQVGQPDLDYLDASDDGKNRGLRLRIPVEEGERYRVGDVAFEGNDVVPDATLAKVFEKLEPGEYYSEEDVRSGFETARELYGSIGYYEMTVFPDLQPRTRPPAAVNGIGDDNDAAPAVVEDRPTHLDGDPLVDITIQVQQGEQYFVNRITFVGNDTTHDQVIRRELQLVERGVFNTEGLKQSIRRLNQLGYFEPLEEGGVDINKSDTGDNEVDLTINLTETNLNQLQFGAGVSQFDGFFGQLGYSTRNFLGRGETLAVSFQRGSRSRDINLSFTEPFLFNRNMSGSIGVFSRRLEWIGAYTEDSSGGTMSVGWPVSLFSRFFLSYSYEETAVTDINPIFNNPQILQFSRGLQDALLGGSNGQRTISKVTPMFQFNTVDHPIFPRTGTRYQAGVDLAGLGGNTNFLKPTLEGIWYLPHTARTTVGIRTQFHYLSAGNPTQIPVFERLWLGGEYSVRGYDIRRIGPTLSDIDPAIPEEDLRGRQLIGGNKSFLFNAEYQITIAGPVRLITFYDAGQVQDFGNNFTLKDFKTSTGVEIRFFMPMINVPFRLIYAWNPQRDGVYDDRFEPQTETVFRFAVGTTF